MCRSIKILFNFEPPVTDAEVRAASLQFVRKVSGFTHPSKTNEPAFHCAVEEEKLLAHSGLFNLYATRAEPGGKSGLDAEEPLAAATGIHQARSRAARLQSVLCA